MIKLFKPALGLAMILCAASAVNAQSTLEAPSGSGQRFQGTILIDPTTGKPYVASGGSGGSGGGGAVYGPDATGAAPTKAPVFIAGIDSAGTVRPLFLSTTGVLSIGNTGFASYGPAAEGTAPGQPPLYNGFKDAAGLTRGVSPTTQLPAQAYDVRGSGTLDATKTSGAGSFIDIPLNDSAVVGLTFQGLAASGATVSYFETNSGGTPTATLSSLNAATGQPSATRTIDGDTRIAVGGHTTLRIQVTTAGTGTISVGYNISAAGTIVDVRSPITIFQGYAALSAANGLPTTDTNASQTIAAPGAAAAKAQAVQGPAGGAVPVGEADGSNVTLGSKADAASAATGATAMAIFRQLHADLLAPTPAGTALIGKVGFDQTTPGTTNKVSIGTDGTVNLGTLNGAATDASVTNPQGSVAPGTAAAKSSLGGGIYNATAPTLTNGQQAALQVDAAGNQKVVFGVTPSVNVNAQYSTSLLSIPANSLFYPQLDLRGHLKTSEAGSSDPLVGITSNGATGSTCSAGTATTACIAKNAAGNLYSAYATETAATSTQNYLVTINATAAPASGAAITPVDFASIPLAAGGTGFINFGAGPPSAYSTGVVVLITTSLTTYTPGTAANVATRVR